jgi:signal transduction histidine kinase
MSSHGQAEKPRWRSNAQPPIMSPFSIRAVPAAAADLTDTDRALHARAEDLATAAATVRALWAEHGHGELLVSPELDAELAGVVNAVAFAAGGGDLALLLESEGDRLMQRRLLETLRGALCDLWSAREPAPAGGDMLPLLRACEAVRRLLDSEWDDDPAALLESPDGLSLVAEVAHDLRSPITAVLFLADNLRRGYSGPLNEVQARQIGIIYGAALGLVEVASDLIDLARHAASEGPPEGRPFSIHELLDAVRSMVLPIAEEKHLELRIRLAEPDQRLGNAIALNRTLLNLATNALKFTEHGHVEIAAEAVDATRVRFSVTDTGKGISHEAQARLFLPFRRRAGRSHAFSGTGLGLVIVRRLVEGMGGELRLESEPDVGTRFHFTIATPPARS